MTRTRCWTLLVPCAAVVLILDAAPGVAAEAPTFERDIRPILKANCFQCHGEQGKTRGGLDVRLRRFIVSGGESGPAVVPGQPGESLLLERVRGGEMPPGKDVKKLSAEQVALIERWITAGATTARPEPEKIGPGAFFTEEDRAFWSFQPIRRPAVPQPKHLDRVRTPIDAFLLQKLEEHRASFSPDADKRTLLRRVYFDLIGLPPSPEETDRFLADESPDAYEQLLGRLLASPHYGERWGRHWLDVAGYADSDGYTPADPVRDHAFRYRDYVIGSFNADKPFDQFIREQLAGDEMVPPPHKNLTAEQAEKLIATGFLAILNNAGDGRFVERVGPAEIVRAEPELEALAVLCQTLLSSNEFLKKHPGEVKYDMANQASDKVLAPLWKFHKHGQCGMELSELLPHLGEIVDDITLVRSMYTDVNNHGSSIRALQTGNILAGRASLGSWITYALGSESQNLPAFVALTDTGPIPVQGVENWSNGFLPAVYQGTVIRPEQPRIMNLEPFPHLKGEVQSSALDLLGRLNRRHLEQRPGNDDLEARIASFELAARMQIAAAEVLDFSGESKETLRRYGLDDPATREYGANCLLARRLIERGVRFVQVYTRSQLWDHHNQLLRLLPECCQRTDRPAAALVKDLKQRGLLDTTIVHWGGEMGRLPVVQTGGSGTRERLGRDHNTHGFSTWLAGGGFRRGHVHGATDEFGHKAVVDRVSHHDYHATLLHLLGLDHKRPACFELRHGGQDDVPE